MPLLELIQAFLAPQVILFLLFGAGALAAALTMLLHPNPVRAALFLVLNLFCVAALYLLLNAYFLAAVQVVVYAGAIMVLFLFVIMLLNLGTPDRTRDKLKSQQPLAVIAGLALAGLVAFSITSDNHLPALDANGNPPPKKIASHPKAANMAGSATGAPGAGGAAPTTGGPGSGGTANPAVVVKVPPAEQGTVAGIGKYLYTPTLPYLFPFEVTSILLLVATVGSVVLAKRKLPGEEPLTGEENA